MKPVEFVWGVMAWLRVLEAVVRMEETRREEVARAERMVGEFPWSEWLASSGTSVRRILYRPRAPKFPRVPEFPREPNNYCGASSTMRHKNGCFCGA